MKLQPETLLKNGSYRIISLLGQGGFGITYLAEHIHMCRKVCIKEFFPTSLYRRDDISYSATVKDDDSVELAEALKAKFLKEARTISAMDNPHIVRVFDSFEENGTAYYVMEYIEGESLASIVARDGALNEATAYRHIAAVADALGYLHARNTLHLDVKPHNIMVRKSDDRAILIDFGLAKHYDDESGSQTTSTLGGRSHGYAPIEQYDDGGVALFSPETDIYSLGATLYYLVTANHPPRASVVGTNGLPALPRSVSAPMRKAITAAIGYGIKQRPHTTAEFMSHLDGGAKEPQPKRKMWWLWLLLLSVVGIVCGIVLLGGEDKEDVVVVTPDTEEVVDINAEPETEAIVPEVKTYKIGDYYNENGKQGVVFEVWDGGRHGKIVSLDDTLEFWDSRVKHDGGYVDGTGTRTYADSKSDGKANTDKIMSRSDSDYFPAFKWCRAKGSSWYLPALNELNSIYKNKSTLNATLQKYGTTLEGWYWASTEYVDKTPEFRAWRVRMYDGVTYYDGKYVHYYVRAVSAF